MKLNELEEKIISKNPVFIAGIGICPSLALTSTIKEAFIIGLSVFTIYFLSSLAISLFKKFIPSRVRLICHLMIIACFTTVFEIFLGSNSILPPEKLNIYIPIIAFNCLILQKLNFYSTQSKIFSFLPDFIYTGSGFFILLLICAFIREFLSYYQILGIKILSSNQTILFFSHPCGAFLSAGIVLGIINFLILRKNKRQL
jgi:electron transport complex protein RnfE